MLFLSIITLCRQIRFLKAQGQGTRPSRRFESAGAGNRANPGYGSGIASIRSASFLVRERYMDKGAPILAFDEFAVPENIPASHYRHVIRLKVDIFGKLLDIYIGAESIPVRLSDLVPLARLLSAKIVSIVKQNIKDRGGTVACRANCAQCCRYLVPLAIPEAMYLTNEVGAMAQWKRALVNEFCFSTARTILESTPKDCVEEFTNIGHRTSSKSKDVSDWYRQINLPCPFLLDNLCVIHEQRPIACREHLVVGSAADCDPNSANLPQVVQMPVSILEVLAHLTSELEQASVEAVMLPFALAWCDDNREYFQHTWPAPELVRRFINVLITRTDRHHNKATAEKIDNS